MITGTIMTSMSMLKMILLLKPLWRNPARACMVRAGMTYRKTSSMLVLQNCTFCGLMVFYSKQQMSYKRKRSITDILWNASSVRTPPQHFRCTPPLQPYSCFSSTPLHAACVGHDESFCMSMLQEVLAIALVLPETTEFPQV